LYVSFVYNPIPLVNNFQKIAGNHTAMEPPPEELLSEWRGTCQVEAPLPKCRGVQGPHATSGSKSGSDLGTILTNLAGPLVKSIATMAMSSLALSSLDPPLTPTEHLSSPPLAIEDELTACPTAFGFMRALSQDTLSKALEAFEEVAYTPDIMGEVMPQCLQDLTGFAEGHAIVLRKFLRDWCGKIDAK
jgi:hypothetical protein